MSGVPRLIGDDKYNLPGYCGPPHRELSSVPRWRVDRESEKHRMLLFDLDQHSRPYWPHWKGYKPQDVRNVQDVKMPTLATSYGQANYLCQRDRDKYVFMKKRDHEKVPTGIKSFFTPGANDTISENGMNMGMRFYQECRPEEGTILSIRANRAIKSNWIPH